MTADTLTITRCDCGLLVWFGGVLAIWQDGTLHTPEACTVTDDLSLVGPEVGP